jgi:hypothetical protein
LQFSAGTVTRLNDVTHVTQMQRLAYSVAQQSFDAKSVSVLDATIDGCTALQILLINPR